MRTRNGLDRMGRADSQADADAMSEWRRKLAPQLMAYKYWQFEFFRQWEELKKYCRERGIRFMGDIPIMLRTTARTCGPIRVVLSGRAGKTDRGFWRAAGLFQRHGTALGIRFIAGSCWPLTDTSGGLNASAHHLHFLKWCGLITFAALKRTGRFPAASRRRFTGAG